MTCTTSSISPRALMGHVALWTPVIQLLGGVRTLLRATEVYIVTTHTIKVKHQDFSIESPVDPHNL